MKIISRKKHDNVITLKAYRSSKYRKQRNLLALIVLIELVIILCQLS
jgi:hypothetical protein